MIYYPDKPGELGGTPCINEGTVGQPHSMRYWPTKLMGRKQGLSTGYPKCRGWLRGLCRALRDGNPMLPEQPSGCELHDPPREPDAGKPHVRFGGQREETRLRKPESEARSESDRILRQVCLPPTLQKVSAHLFSTHDKSMYLSFPVTTFVAAYNCLRATYRRE